MPMREIRFRGWDGDKMTYDGFLVTSEGGVYWEGGMKPADLELMQFTGLKDKNGKEIYEGDIVRSEHGDGGPIIEAISWGVAEFLSGRLALRAWSFLNGKCDTIEVIGNIYENPDLLETDVQ